SRRSSSERLVSRGDSGADGVISAARSIVTRRRSHKSGCGTGEAMIWGGGDAEVAGGGGIGASAGRGAARDAAARSAALGAARRTGAGADADAGASPARRPHFSMRGRQVLGEIPSTAAVREMFQSVWRRTSATRSRTASSSELAPPGATPAGTGDEGTAGETGGRPSASAVTSGSLDRSATRSIRLASSRTLPGHGYARSAARASGKSVLADTP